MKQWKSLEAEAEIYEGQPRLKYFIKFDDGSRREWTLEDFKAIRVSLLEALNSFPVEKHI